MLKVDKVSKDYQMGRETLRVLDEVNLQIDRGEMIGIQGPSGAGKSTLLHLIGLLDTPTEGRVLHEGDDLACLSGREQAHWRNRLFGFVFQFFHLLPDFTAAENVALPALAGLTPLRWRNGRKKADQRAGELLELVGLGARTDHRPGQLSGGERQRVAIARALMNEPEVLLCDEPTGNLDTDTGASILDLLCNLKDSTEVTLVIVTHDPQVAARTERTVQMIDGKIDNSPD
ncbi:MAG: ABC transporter ATP-binding protein [Planctomycetota bacterium]